MSNAWRHTVCRRCWRILQGNQEPIQLEVERPELCCICRELTAAGIYVRFDPAKMPCQGKTGTHEGKES